jgi:hypothetical protein
VKSAASERANRLESCDVSVSEGVEEKIMRTLWQVVMTTVVIGVGLTTDDSLRDLPAPNLRLSEELLATAD